MGNHIVNQINHPELNQRGTLHVIGVISNPARYHSRYRLYREWEERMLKTKNVNVITVEIAFGDRKHEVTSPDNPNHLQLRTKHELWHKENMINLGVRLLPRDWKYLAWVDCDVAFQDPEWAVETVQQLQHYDVIQPWQDCLDLGPHGSVLTHFKSFCYLASQGEFHPKKHPYGMPYGHSGFAWACTRRFWENVHGLMDFPILGSGDHHMACGMVKKMDYSVHMKVTEAYKELCREWQRLAWQVTKGHVGFLPGRIEHHFHGPKKRRQYVERWDILIKHKFDPTKDLAYDEQGLLFLKGKPDLANDIRKYMRFRHEDSIEEV